MTDSEEVYLITTSRWNPHYKAYTSNKKIMIYWEGHLIEKKDRQHFLLSEIEEDVTIDLTSKV